MSSTGRTPGFFHEAYLETAPWDIGRPQPAVLELARSGELVGNVLDVGCGTADNAIHLASLGQRVVGVDLVPRALEIARERATVAGVELELHTGSALELDRLGLSGPFDAALDAGVFHIFEDDERPRYVAALRSVLPRDARFHTVVFSEHAPEYDDGPRRVTRRELRECFASGWAEIEIVESRYHTRNAPDGRPAWRASFERR